MGTSSEQEQPESPASTTTPASAAQSNQAANDALGVALSADEGEAGEEDGGGWPGSLDAFGHGLVESIIDTGKSVVDTLGHLADADIAIDLALGDVKEYQKRIDELDAQVRKGDPLSEDDEDFLHSLYWWIGVGGRAKGLPEASALMRNYVEGSGEALEIDSEVYEESAIVRYAMEEIKCVIAEDIRTSGEIRNGGAIASTDVLEPTQLGDQERLGEIIDGGYLLAEQGNRRLKYANNRFKLQSFSEVLEDTSGQECGVTVETRWRVDDVWDFESYAEQAAAGRDDVTVIPLPNDESLRLPDGLSAAMAEQGAAAEFTYYAEWTERWNPLDQE